MNWNYNDGGRELAGFKGSAGDCVVRAIAIATGDLYHRVYNDLWEFSKAKGHDKSPRDGVPTKIVKSYLEHLGWQWKATMHIGSGTTVHLKKDELPSGNIICRVTKHVVAVKDGVVQDTYDCTREGTRAVYGYWFK